MSRHWSRSFAGALVCAAMTLLPVLPAQASSPAATPAAASFANSQLAALQKFRDSPVPVMQSASQLEATAAPSKFRSTSRITNHPLSAVSNPRLYREVFGFAFASSLGDPTIGYPSWNFTLLSTVAYFGIHVDWTGDFSGGSALNTWNDPSGPVPPFIQTAHANGTKVVLTIAMFDSTSGTPNMCSALQRSALTIQRTVAEVNAKGIDGVNVDYESNNTPCTDPMTGATQSSQSLFTSFVRNLRAAMPAGSYLSVDTYSGAAGFRDSSGAYLGFFDIGALANYADSFFVMAYDMEYSNWNAAPLNCSSFCLGPTAPLSTYLFNDTRAAAEYTAVVPASKIIMGVPYYGRKECVAVTDPNTIPPNAQGTGVAADGYLDAQAESTYPGNTLYATHLDTHDALGATRWDTFSSTSAGCNRELYWDDATAIGNKYDLVIKDHLRGAGIFALNYGGGAPELWNLISLKFGQCSQAAVTSDKTTPQIPGTAVTFTGSALCAGTANYRFWMQPPGGAFSVMQDYSTNRSWSWVTTGQPLGTYTIQLDARNQGSTVALDTYMRISFQLALCVTPTIAADHASPQLVGAAITFTPSVTCQGTPEYQYWVMSPGGSWTMAQDYGVGSTFRWDTSHASGYGDYAIGVHVRTTGTTVAYESAASIPYSLKSCTSPTLTTNKASPQPTGTQIALSGTATCDGTPQYRFMIQPPGGSWSVVQDFGSSAAFTWNGAGPGGAYNLELDARSAAAPASTMVSATLAYTLSSCSAVTLTTSVASPQPPGPVVVLTGAATCPGTPQYRFSITNPGGTVTVVQDFGVAATYSWATTGLALGSYGLEVDARDAGATTNEAAATASFYLSDPPCATPTLTPNLASPQQTGTAVTFTATSSGCPHPLYEFWLQASGSSTWHLLQAYSTNATYVWNSTGAPNGTVQFSVWVRDDFSLGAICVTGQGCNDASAVIPYSVTAPFCPSVTISATPTTVMHGTGAHVTITAAATGCTNSPRFEFWLRPATSTIWLLLQGYGTSLTYDWNTAGAAAGTLYLGVWVRDANSPAASDATASMPFVISSPCTSVTASATPTSVLHGSGTHMTITGAAAGCTNSPVYEFWLRAASSSSWQMVQGYGPSATYDWNSTGAAVGTVYMGVWTRDSNSVAAYDAVDGIPITVTAPSCPSVSISAAPTTVVHSSSNGTHVTITASATGCATSARYEFWLRPASSNVWLKVQGFGTSATYDWNSTGAASGTVYLGVWATDANSSAAYDSVAGTPVAVT